MLGWSLAGAMALGACDGGGGPAARALYPPTTEGAPMSAPSTSEPAATGPSGGPTTAGPAAPVTSVGGTPGTSMCLTTQLAVRVEGAEGGLSHAGSAIVFKNNGRPCVVSAYPGVDGLGPKGEVVVSARRTPGGYVGGVGSGGSRPTVELATGSSASALLEGIIAPVDGAPPCPVATSLLITPPNETHSVRLAVRFELCGLEIHPVVPGTTSSAERP